MNLSTSSQPPQQRLHDTPPNLPSHSPTQASQSKSSFVVKGTSTRGKGRKPRPKKTNITHTRWTQGEEKLLAKINYGDSLVKINKKKESIQIESHKSSIEHPIVNDFVVINIPEEDVEPKQIILDPDDQPMWESAKTVAPTPNSAIVQPNVDENFVINSTHLKMISENKFDVLDGYPLRNPDANTRGIFLYKSPNQAFKFLEDKVLFEHDWSTKFKNEHHQKSVAFANESDSNTNNSRFMEKVKAMDSQFQSLKEEMHEMRNKYQDLRDNHDPKNHLNDDTPMCERHEVNYHPI
ncbi:hypothetical protein Tco_0415204 [Tanacetum coccineum]